MMTYRIVYSNTLEHHGVLGMKWGVWNSETRSRYQNKRREKIQNSKSFKRDYELYRKQGHSDEAAKRLAFNKDKLKKTLAIVGGVTVAALAGYAIYKYGRSEAKDILEKNGMTLLKGSSIQRITSDADDFMKLDRFYASTSKEDNVKYIGNFALSNVKLQGKTPFKVKLKTTKDIKIASQDEAKNVFKNLMKTDKEFNSIVNEKLGWYAQNYKQFNTYLVAKDSINSNWVGWNKATSKFYDKLKEKGFSGVFDYNDMRGNSYDSKSPVIIFDKDAFVKSKTSKITLPEILVNNKLDQIREDGAKYLASAGLAGAGFSYLNYKDNEDTIIEQDKKNRKKNKK